MKALVVALGLILVSSIAAQANPRSYTEYETASWAKYNSGSKIEANCRTTFAIFSARQNIDLRNVRLQLLSVPGYMTISGNQPNGRPCAMNCSRGYTSEVYCSRH